MGGARRAAPVVAIAIAAALLYAPSLGFGFTFDDANTILGHVGVRRRLSVEDMLLRDFWGRSYLDTIGTWRPLTTFSYWLDWHASGGRPAVFHAVNLALYAVTLGAAHRFLRLFFGPGLSPGARRLVVAAYGTLAIHADVVPSATGRAEILAALFSLLALSAPLRVDGPVRVREILATAVASALAIAAKESALPVAILAPWLAWRWHRPRATARRDGLFALVLTCALALLGIAAFRTLRMPWIAPGLERATENPLLGRPRGERWLGAAEVFGDYLGHTLWPVRLAPDYSYAAIVPGHAVLAIAAGLAVATGVAVVAARTYGQGPGIADAAVGLVASYAVVSHVLVPAIVVLADRLFFFPSFWVLTLLSLGLDRLGPPSRAWAARAAIAFVLLQGAAAVGEGVRWRDDVTLLSAAVRARPTVARSRRNLGQALADVGRAEDAAWQVAVSHAILARFPAPIADDVFPPGWDDVLPAARLALFQARLGPSRAASALRQAAATLHRWGNDDAAAIASQWEHAGAAAPSGHDGHF